ncbi:hypothetical protein BH24CHL5_BH24CHL5_06990 [soil metagenome]
MSRTQRRIRIGPPLQLLGIALVLTAVLPAHAAADAVNLSLAGAACPRSPDDAAGAALGRATSDARTTLNELIDRRGQLTGWSLQVTRDGAPLTIALPAESSVAPVICDAIVYALSTATGSEIHLLDISTGCDTILARPDDIVRSAVLDPSGSAVFFHSVTRPERSDAGVVRIDLLSGAANTVVPALVRSDDREPTFMTELRFSLDGSALAVHSCGFETCRTRILDLFAGKVTAYDASGNGPLIGLTRRHLVTFAACGGPPCSITSTDRQTGARQRLVEDALAASLQGDGDGVLTVTTAAGVVELEQ